MNSYLYRNVPTLDLHGYDRYTGALKLNDFIKDNIKLRNEVLLIVHGIGTGVLKKTVLMTLKNNKNVLEYKLDIANPGATFVKLKFWFDKGELMC